MELPSEELDVIWFRPGSWPNCRSKGAVTAVADRDRVLEAIDAGAAGYVLKDSDGAEVVRAIRAAAAGDAPLGFEGSATGTWRAPLRIKARVSGGELDGDAQGTRHGAKKK